MTAAAWTPEVETRLVVAARGPGTHGLVERRVLAAALAEIERLRESVSRWGEVLVNRDKSIAELEAETERLKTANEELLMLVPYS